MTEPSLRSRTSVVRVLAFLALFASVSSRTYAGGPCETTKKQRGSSAQVLFKRAILQMNLRRFARACPMLEESLALEEVPEVRFRLAQCYEQLKRLGSAWRNYRKAAQLADQQKMTDNAVIARKRGLALEARLSKARLIVPPELVANANVEIRFDGRVIRPSKWKEPIVVDQGDHVVAVTDTTSDTRWSTQVDIKGEGSVVDVRLRTPPRMNALVPEPSWSDRHVGSLVTASVSGAIVLAGLGVGIVTYTEYEELRTTCAGVADGCLRRDTDAVGTKAMITNILLGAGAAAGVAAVVLYVVEEGEGLSEKVDVAIGPAGVVVRGVF